MESRYPGAVLNAVNLVRRCGPLGTLSDRWCVGRRDCPLPVFRTDSQPRPIPLLTSGTSIDVLPVDGNKVVGVDGASSTPTQPASEGGVAPRDFQKARREYPNRHVDAGGRTTSVGAELVGCGGTAGPGELALLVAGPPAGGDENPSAASAFLKTLSSRPDAVHSPEIHSPTSRQVTGVRIHDAFTIGHTYQLGIGRPFELTDPSRRGNAR